MYREIRTIIGNIENIEMVYEEEDFQSKRFRMKEQKTFEIKNSHTTRRKKAHMLKHIALCLFGRNRFKNIFLESTEKNSETCLQIANFFQKRVEMLSFIKSTKSRFVEYDYEGANGSKKTQSIFVIKMTMESTLQDKMNRGFNKGHLRIEASFSNSLKEKIISIGYEDKTEQDETNQEDEMFFSELCSPWPVKKLQKKPDPPVQSVTKIEDAPNKEIQKANQKSNSNSTQPHKIAQQDRSYLQTNIDISEKAKQLLKDQLEVEKSLNQELKQKSHDYQKENQGLHQKLQDQSKKLNHFQQENSRISQKIKTQSEDLMNKEKIIDEYKSQLTKSQITITNINQKLSKDCEKLKNLGFIQENKLQEALDQSKRLAAQVDMLKYVMMFEEKHPTGHITKFEHDDLGKLPRRSKQVDSNPDKFNQEMRKSTKESGTQTPIIQDLKPDLDFLLKLDTETLLKGQLAQQTDRSTERSFFSEPQMRNPMKQSKNLANSSKSVQVLCISGNKAQSICTTKNCNSNAFICEDKFCQRCHKHKNSHNQSRTGVVPFFKKIQNTHKSENILRFDQIIHAIQCEFGQIQLEIIEQMQKIGYSDARKRLIEDIRKGRFMDVNGNLAHQALACVDKASYQMKLKLKRIKQKWYEQSHVIIKSYQKLKAIMIDELKPKSIFDRFALFCYN